MLAFLHQVATILGPDR